MELPQPHKTDASDIAFRDPLSDETRKVRGHLMVVAVVAVMVHAFHLKPKSLLDIELPEGTPALLEGALSVVLAYYLVVFLLYGYMDLRRWRIAGQVQMLPGTFDLLLRIFSCLHETQQHLGKMTADLPLQAEVRAAVAASAKTVPDQIARLNELRTSVVRLNQVQWVRVIVIEASAPILLGAFALWRVHDALLPFLRAAVQ